MNNKNNNNNINSLLPNSDIILDLILVEKQRLNLKCAIHYVSISGIFTFRDFKTELFQFRI